MKALGRFQIILVLGLILFGTLVWHLIHTLSTFAAFDYLNQLYYVFWHEGMHAATTVLTLGSVEQMMVMHRLGGYVYSRGAAAIVVFPAGYIGPVVFSCFILYRSIKHPQQSDFLTFGVGVASMIIAGLFTTTEPVLRALSLGFVAINIAIFMLKANTWRLGFLIYIIVGLCAITLVVQYVHVSNDDSANLTYLVGVAVGGVLTFTGATGKVFQSLVVMSVVNSSLLYNAISRATEMGPQVHSGVQNDPAMLAGILGWSPLFMSDLWMIIIWITVLFTCISIIRIVVSSK